MFRGEYHNHVDDKGRVSIPSKFRDFLTESHEFPLVLTLGFDQCLWLYPGDTWKKNEQQLSQLSPFDADSRQLVRAFLRASEECDFDKQGRIVIPPVLRKGAGIVKNVVIVGMLNRIEIWDRERYESDQASSAQSLDKLAQKLADKNIVQGLTL